MSVNRKVTVAGGTGRAGHGVPSPWSLAQVRWSVDDLAEAAGDHAQHATAPPPAPRAGRARSPRTRARGSASGSSAATCAMRGPPSSTDSSPKNSPGPSRATTVPSRITRTMPSTTTKKPVPISPWRAMTRSAGKSTSIAAAATARRGPPRPAPGTAGSRRSARSAGPGSASSVLRGVVGRSWCAAAAHRVNGTGGARSADRRAGHSIRSHGHERRGEGASSDDDGRRRRMATREEIADILAGFTLFGDLQTPQLLGVAGHLRRGRVPDRRADPAPGPDRLGVLRDPRRHRGRPDRRRAARAPSGRGDFFGEVSILLGEPPTADVVALDAAALHPDRRPRRARASSSATRRSCSGCSRRRPAGSATRTAGGADAGGPADTRPFPPGEYPVIVIGSGPGRPAAVVRPQALRRRRTRCCPPTRRRAACSGAGRSSSACSRGRSRTRPRQLTSREYQRYDWNSLIAVRARAARRSRPSSWTASSYFPSRPEMEANLDGVRGAGRDRRPLRLPLGADAPRGRPRRRRCSSLETTDGEYRCRNLVLAVGVAEPWSPATPGIEHAAPLRRDARRVVVRRQAAVHHRQAELRLRARVRAAAVGVEDHGRPRRRPPRRRSRRKSLVGVRARYVQPFEDNFLGLGVSILDASIDGIEPRRRRVPGQAQADRQRRADRASRPTRSSPRPGSPARSSDLPTSA